MSLVRVCLRLTPPAKPESRNDRLEVATSCAPESKETRPAAALAIHRSCMRSTRRGGGLLPITIEAGGPQIVSPEETFDSKARTYTVFYFVQPWKSSGGYRICRRKVPGRFSADFRKGEFVRLKGAESAGEWVAAVGASRRTMSRAGVGRRVGSS